MSIANTGIPNIRVVIREVQDENLFVDVPSLVVKVERSPEYNVNVVPSTQVVLRTGSYFNVADLALQALSSSYALTASYVDTINRNISGSVIVTGSVTITDNLSVEGIISAEQLIVSSSIIFESGSTKFGDSLDDTHQFTGSVLVEGPIEASSGITGSFKGDGSQLTGLVTDLRISGSVGSDVLGLLTDDLTIVGNNGIITTVTDNTITIDVPETLTASLFGTASVAEGIHIVFAGEYETGSDGVIIPTPSGGLSYITSASYALTASYFDNNTWNNLLNKPEGLVSSSVQVFYFPVQTAISSSYAVTASYALNGGGEGGSGTSGTSGTSGINGTSGTSGISPSLSSGILSSSVQLTELGFVSSSTINTIQTITSASYAAITPVSGTLYIVID